MRIVFPSHRAGEASGGGTLPHSVCCSSVRVTAMYTTAVGWKHMIGLVCAVVVLVFGVTYTTMILGYKPGTGPGPITAVTQLIQDGDLLAGNEPREMEWHQEAHRIFWFRNDKAEPVKVWLHRKSCKCTRVDGCILPEEWKALSADEKDKRADDPALSWQ